MTKVIEKSYYFTFLRFLSNRKHNVFAITFYTILKKYSILMIKMVLFMSKKKVIFKIILYLLLVFNFYCKRGWFMIKNILKNYKHLICICIILISLLFSVFYFKYDHLCLFETFIDLFNSL